MKGICRFTAIILTMAIFTSGYCLGGDVVGSYLFYNQSSFDGNAAGADSLDDQAIAIDKAPLLPGGQAAFANYSSFSRGLNGVMIDIAGLPEMPGKLTVDDFQFRVGNDNWPAGWADGPCPVSVTIRHGAGVDSSDRVTLIWADGAIQQTWLQIVVLPTNATGLSKSHIVYFGHSAGETGNSPDNAIVDATDEIGTRNNPRSFANPAGIDMVYDFDRNGKVDATDQLIVRNHINTFLNCLKLINPPSDVLAVEVGQPQYILLPATVELSATVTDDGLPNPPGAVTVMWDQVSGPLQVDISDKNTLQASCQPTEAGEYIFKVTASDGENIASDLVEVNCVVPRAKQWSIFDGGQLGNLPPMIFSRDLPTIDGLGNPVAANTPRYGVNRSVSALEPWELVKQTEAPFRGVWSGFDRDGETPLIGLVHFGLKQFYVYLDSPLDGPADIVLNFRRVDPVSGTTVVDVLNGDRLQKEDVAYTPTDAGVVLPGCFVIPCQRFEDVDPDPEVRQWEIQGVSVLVYERIGEGNGPENWQWRIIGEGSRFLPGRDRLREWSMCSYYPYTYEHPLKRAFIPFVDYVMDSSGLKGGGQLFLFDAQRADVDSPWKFGPLYKVFEDVIENTHFHSAGWTHNGVVLTVADGGISHDEDKRFICSDWDDYANPANWTRQDRFFGASTRPVVGEAEYVDQPIATPSSRWFGSVPGNESNSLLVTADGDSAVLWKIKVPDDPRARGRYVRVWGQEASTGRTQSFATNLSGWLHRPAPERSKAVVTRFYNEGSCLGVKYGRVLYSPDGEHFSHVARMPSSSSVSSTVVLHDGEIVLVPKISYGSKRGIWSIPAMDFSKSRRGLMIDPGGVNEMYINSQTKSFDNLFSGSGNTVTKIRDAGGAAMDPDTGMLIDVPTMGPVYRIVTDGSNRIAMGMYPGGDEMLVKSGIDELVFWVKVLGNEGVRLLSSRVINSATYSQLFVIKEVGQWVKCRASMDTSNLSDISNSKTYFYIADSNGESYCSDFLIAFDGFFPDAHPTYPMLPNGVGSNLGDNEQLTQPLPLLGYQYSIAVELQIPDTGLDSYLEDFYPESPLLTIYGDESHYIEIIADYDADKFVARVFNDAALVKTLAIDDMAVNRLDRARLVIVNDPITASTYFYSMCGGSTEKGIGHTSAAIMLDVQPTEIRFGNYDFSQVSSLEVLSVVVEPDRAIGIEQFNAIFEVQP